MIACPYCGRSTCVLARNDGLFFCYACQHIFDRDDAE